MTELVAVIAPDLALAAAIIFAAGLMRGFTGFGSAMMVAPLYSLIYGPVQAVAMVMLLETAVTLLLLPKAVRETRWREIGPMAVGASLAVPAGGWILTSVDPEIMRRVIALAVVAFALVMLVGWRYRGARNRAVSVAVGAASGTMMGSVGMGGPPVILYLLSGPDAAAQNRANIITYFAIGGLAVLITFVLKDVIGAETVWRSGLLALPFLVSAQIGARLFRRSSEALYRRIALYFLLAIAVATLLA